VLSLYFQDPSALGMTALQAGLATLPAAAGMILITPFITPLASKIGAGRAVALGFVVATAGFTALAFVYASWTYAAFVLPLVAVAVGLGVANGPASSGSTAAVPDDQVGQASGISNMARYIGGSVAVAAAAMIDNAVANHQLDNGASKSEALAAGFSRASLLMAIWAVCGVALLVLMRRYRPQAPRGVDRAAAAAATSHTIPATGAGMAGDEPRIVAQRRVAR
jgi:MFS family permease